MKIPPIKLVSVLFLIIFLINGCSEDVDKNSSANTSASNEQKGKNKIVNPNPSKDDAEELSRIIKMPVPPEETTWREEGSDTPNTNNANSLSKGRTLTAVLKFNAEDARKLIEQIDKNKSAAAYDIDAESWFPPELIAKSQESGDENLKGMSYPADDFLQEPYKNGKITRITDTDYFVLELTSF